MEGLENQFLLLRRNPGAGILDCEINTVLGFAEHGIIDAPALRRYIEAQLDVATRRELERIRQKILQDLLKTLRIALDAMRKPISKLPPEREVLGCGNMPECAFDIIAQTIEGYLLDFESNSTRLNLRQIQYVVDQLQQIGP